MIILIYHDEDTTLFKPMEHPIEFEADKSGWSIVYIEGSWVIISKTYVFLSLEIDFAFKNARDPDEMTLYAAFHLGLYCLPKSPLRCF